MIIGQYFVLVAPRYPSRPEEYFSAESTHDGVAPELPSRTEHLVEALLFETAREAYDYADWSNYNFSHWTVARRPKPLKLGVFKS